MGAGLSAIGALASSNVHAGLYAERHLAEIETARKIIAGMPSRRALPVGTSHRRHRRARLADQFNPHRRPRRGWRCTLDSATHRGVGAVAVRRNGEDRHDPSAEAAQKNEAGEFGRVVAGFSLIEAMATLALTATIILALSSVAGQWLPNWRRGFVDLQRADLLGVGLERLVDDLSAAEYVTPSAGARGAVIRRRRFFGDVRSIGYRSGRLSSSGNRASGGDQGGSRPRDGADASALRADSAETAGRAGARLSPSAILSPSFARPSTFPSPMQDQTAFGFRVGKVASSCPRRCAYRSGTRSPIGCSRRRPWRASGSQPRARPSLRRKRMRAALFLGGTAGAAMKTPAMTSLPRSATRAERWLCPHCGALDPCCSCDPCVDLFFLHCQHRRRIAGGRRPRAGGGLDSGRRRNGGLPSTRGAREGQTGPGRLRHARGAHWRLCSLSLRGGKDRPQRRARGLAGRAIHRSRRRFVAGGNFRGAHSRLAHEGPGDRRRQGGRERPAKPAPRTRRRTTADRPDAR